ncbi:flagellar basal body-associated protein FliL [Endozoicomonas sp. SM1973]|uniref:Flagellar protein FliL n=1 Tax=Spartinivicinus marinus TaxID=2994442 RepID=A0A853IDF9_9GAMM|nr:flagellar basal body-associated FliL family protein [Spartinivicinus marinus]MCX4027109.1 flagellar basal body-associated FliL family protein [Spartinivicinus marinus]NYZ68588.1 flagellar basal body-associated protein FliL [Spartinivicinus marinus]
MLKKALFFINFLFISLCLISHHSTAEEGDEKGAVEYIELKPSFVVNYGEIKNRLKYLKADISVRVYGKDAVTKVEQHMPLLRDGLVLLFSRQLDKDISNAEGKESLRQEALKIIQDRLKEEEGKPIVDDLLFTSFVVQR